MVKKNWSPNQILGPTFITLIALAIVYAFGMTFVTIEIERFIERTITPQIRSNINITAMERAIFTDYGAFMQSHHIRIIGYACLGLVILLTVIGLLTKKRGLASLGSAASVLSIYGYFVIHMSFLAGLGALAGLWLPFWGNLVKLGDIVYLPYMLLVFPFSLAGIDIRMGLSRALTDLGLLIFVLGILAWFYARLQRKGTADFWIYRFTRHPQYLGWIIWSYGLMLRASISRGIPLGHANPGASFPWVLSTMIIICVALSEEVDMSRRYGDEYENYRAGAPFMIPLPTVISRVLSAPFRLIMKKARPEDNRDVIWTFFIYLAAAGLISLPFILLGWPPGGGWMDWPAFQ